MKNVTIKTTITLDEARAKNDPEFTIVSMVLDTRKQKSSCGTLWCLDKQMVKVDQIHAKFRDDEGKVNDTGKATTWISLLGGRTFVEPYISTSKHADPKAGIEGIEYRCEKDDSILVLEFLEPVKGGEYNHPKIYFHTSDGLIDPEISVTRGTGH